MSQMYDGRGMDSAPASGSVRRAREMAQGGYPRQQPLYPDNMNDSPPGELRAPPRRPMGGHPSAQSRLPKPKAAPAIDYRSGNSGVAISRPQQVPQWPLPGPPMAAMNSPDPEPYRPPPGRPTQAPQRPPRPSQVPSLLDQSRLQEPTPVFLTPESDDYHSSVPPSPSSRMTTSSLGSLPDFPEPNQSTATDSNRRSVNLGPPRASANLGPPPSSRRGASSFYSHASFVSPIPEESLNSRSHGSYASSAAMPESWPAGSRAVSPSYYDETDNKSQDSAYDEFHDESKLVRSASIGKRGKPSIVTTKSFIMEPNHRPAPSPVQPFDSGTGYIDASTSSSNTLPLAKTSAPSQNPHDSLSPDAILGAYAAASATNLSEVPVPAPTPSPQPYSRLSAIRRPPKLDIEAVRRAEERGSITSLPDLIRRATRLATMIDSGKRPASRFDNLNDFFDDKGQTRGGDKENSGLSDMLAAFPPPAQQPERQNRGSWFRTTSWPLAPTRQGDAPSRSGLREMTPSDEGRGKRRRRCCGLPVWAFVLLLLLLVGIILAAVLVPLEFFVFKNLGNDEKPKSALAQCQESLKCQNGGTNIMSQGTCSCICTNGFTGSDCSAGGSDGCTTTDLGNDLNNVTLGKSIPRLIENSQKNFSVPLSGTAIMAKINAAELSCIAQNSLVTFDGAAARKRTLLDSLALQFKREAAAPTLIARAPETAPAVVVSSETAAPTTLVVDEGSPENAPTSTSEGGNAAQTSAAADPSQTQDPMTKFKITNEVLDFARIAVLYVLQEEDVESAEDAQSSLAQFFAKARKEAGVLVKEAANVSIGDKESVDLLRYKISIGSKTIGGNVKRHVLSPMAALTHPSLRHRAVHGPR
ncbi:uncharacterized protein FPRO_09479 [Fusarium proliferatum ET1]|uniref:EGF-like domain-containing protein n=1 Tax=Fusarium proliferatum (strain ET1) TaxID=1227346 RepID=A0A1L7VNT2_FUSPR|nr:uncharacterized protein FPRO_09479 [Fusarium proliferatum ET1]CZR42178.1 uncharacterized protein FPRO_09479 [Fusarium proliferatum ET1]